MNRLSLFSPDQALRTAAELHQDIERRAYGGPVGQCPVDELLSFVRLSFAQTCGKCVPCRVGISQITVLMEKILDGKGTEQDLASIAEIARNIELTADCVLGRQAAQMVLRGLEAYEADFKNHIATGVCSGSSEKRVPCVGECPAHVDIPGYIALTREGRYEDAVKLIRKDNPFPVACAYVCEHPCENHCRRTVVDAPVNIRGLKRFAVDSVTTVPTPDPLPLNGKKVAVVGGGPSGLTAAYFLSLMGYAVTLYEQRKSLGGMIRYGIPAYRLPRKQLDRDIEACLAAGVEVHTGVSIGKDITLDQLRGENDAVYLAIGAHSDKKLGLDGEDAEGVFSAVQMLRSIGDLEYPDFKDKKVVVVGGGNVAMDCARSSVRLGASSVSIVYRRRKQDMTALPEEVDSAVAEGCDLIELNAPVRIEKDAAGKVAALITKPQMISVVKRGRPAPVDADKPERRIEADVIVVAIGQAIDSAYFGEKGLPLKKDTLAADKNGGFAGMEGVFAGGDCVTGPATVIRAIEAGKVAAANIDEYLGGHHPVSVDIAMPEPTFRDQPACGRVQIAELPAMVRNKSFELCDEGMSKEEAMQECGRCLMCDHYGYGSFKGGREQEW